MGTSRSARSDILDYFVLSERPFHGNMSLISFLKRIWDLSSMPSTDPRYQTAEWDIQTHMISFNDWTYDYLLYDYLNILDSSDETFLAFLEMCLNPLVVSEENQINEMLTVFNTALEPQSYRLEPSGRRAGKTTYKAVRCDPQQNKPVYEVVFSFAGEDREYVERVAGVLREHHVKVFYDKFEEVALWGKDLSEYLGLIYSGDARYCVMFISKSYAEKAWTTHEKRNALAKALNEKIEYILPARFDDTEIPGLPSTIGYVDLKRKTPRDLAIMIMLKLGRLSNQL